MLMGLIGGRDSMDRLAHSDLARDSLIPADIEPGQREALERAGVSFGAPDERSPRLLRVVLPEGWKIVKSDHPMYSNLLDDAGRARATIAYSRIDGVAWTRCLRRFRAGYVTDDPFEWRNEPLVPAILDSGGAVLWRGTKVPRDTEEQRRAAWRSEEVKTDVQKATAAAEAKLDEVAPRWRDASAYWNEEVEFPPHETPPDARPLYSLRVELRDEGRHVDNGEHVRARARDDNEALSKLRKAAVDMLSRHDEVRYWIVDVATSRVAHHERIHRPRPEDEFDAFRQYGFYGSRHPRRGH